MSGAGIQTRAQVPILPPRNRSAEGEAQIRDVTRTQSPFLIRNQYRPLTPSRLRTQNLLRTESVAMAIPET